MKKITALVLLMLSITLVMLLPVQAAQLDLVYDEVELLSEDENSKLNELAQEITDKYQCEVSIVIIEDKGEGDIVDIARAVYDEYDFGYGADKSGLMLFISMKERDYTFTTVGAGNTAFTDYGKGVLEDDYLLPQLGENNYYDAFYAYLNQTAELLKTAENGTPFDVDTNEELAQESSEGSFWIRLAIVILVPLIIAGVVCFIFLGQMKTAVSQRTADNFMTDSGPNLTMKVDQFVSRSETRTKIEKTPPSSRSSSGSGGSSNGAGKF